MFIKVQQLLYFIKGKKIASSIGKPKSVDHHVKLVCVRPHFAAVIVICVTIPTAYIRMQIPP